MIAVRVAIAAVLAALVIYVVGTFITWNPDPSEWESRISAVIFWIGLAILFSSIAAWCGDEHV